MLENYPGFSFAVQFLVLGWKDLPNFLPPMSFAANLPNFPTAKVSLHTIMEGNNKFT